LRLGLLGIGVALASIRRCAPTVTVGPPSDLLAYSTDELDITPPGARRDDADLVKIGARGAALRMAVGKLPEAALPDADGG